MFQKHLYNLYLRDIHVLHLELEKFEENESLLWTNLPGISNCSGNLFLHIIGNINHFMGAIISNNGFIREREKEFNEKNIPLSSLKSEIQKLNGILEKAFIDLKTLDLEKEFPVLLNQKTYTYSELLLHLFGHLNYHLGQINYHRRMVFASL